MFGKKKELEFKEKINTILNRIKETKTSLEEISKENNVREEELSQKLRLTIDCDENIKRDIKYVGIISGEAVKELEVQSKLIENQADRLKQLTEAVKDREVFDTEKISRGTNRILEGVKVEDRYLGSIREEIRGLEVLGVSIKDIANQTSALSLNAAIMGARLENGNDGFVQTATEIKELASECAKSVAELNRRLEAIQNHINELDKEGQALREAAGDSSMAAEVISRTYEDIHAKFTFDADEKDVNVNEVVSKLHEISNAVTELDEKQTDKLDSMSEIVEVANLQLEGGKALENIILDIDKII